MKFFNFLGNFFFATVLGCTFSYSSDLEEIPLNERIGRMIMVGFPGTDPHDKIVKPVLNHIENKTIGGVILYNSKFSNINIESPEQLKKLTGTFKDINQKLDIALDQEGGKVQRIKFSGSFPTAKDIATKSLDEASLIYQKMAKELSDYNITLNLGPVVDLDNPLSEAIGKYERSYSKDPQVVIDYARTFIKAHHQYDVKTALKHVPGHGLVEDDTHLGLVDGTSKASKDELIPFYTLKDETDMIMTAHLIRRDLDETYPVTLSPTILKTLLRDTGFQKPIISDDLLMKAISDNYGFEKAVVLSINAGCDYLLFSKMTGNFEKEVVEDIPTYVNKTIQKAIQNGDISEKRINDSYKRLEDLNKVR